LASGTTDARQGAARCCNVVCKCCRFDTIWHHARCTFGTAELDAASFLCCACIQHTACRRHTCYNHRLLLLLMLCWGCVPWLPCGSHSTRYQPYDLGFQHSVLPTPYIFKDNLMYINGLQKQTKGKHCGCTRPPALQQVCGGSLLGICIWVARESKQ
jgi:hypothetical protein